MQTRLIVLVGLLAGVSAHAESRIYAQVQCDSKAGALAVSEVWAEDESELPRVPGAELKPMGDLVRVVTGDLGDYLVQDKDWETECDLNGVKYQVRISPWKFNAKVNGMCGGGDPSVELSVTRSQVPLIHALIFSGYCPSDGAQSDQLLIESISFEELKLSARFVVSDGAERSEFRLPFDGLEKINRAELWETFRKNLTSDSRGRELDSRTASPFARGSSGTLGAKWNC